MITIFKSVLVFDFFLGLKTLFIRIMKRYANIFYCSEAGKISSSNQPLSKIVAIALIHIFLNIFY